MSTPSAAGRVDYEQLSGVERTCLSVAFARWHASGNGTMPCTWPDGRPWYTDPLGPLFVRGIPPYKQQEFEEVRVKGDSWMRLFCAVRTTEIDHHIQEAVAASSGIRQMVLMGAGMDTRAWRLQWPPCCVVFEVDSQQVLSFKHSMLHTHGSSSEIQKQQQQQEEAALPQPSCERRVAVAADASQPQELWSRLVSAGLSPDTPTVWVLEGFIGYLTREAGDGLLQHLSTHSAPGSRIIMTAPPTPADRDEGHVRTGDQHGAAADAGRNDSGGGGQGESGDGAVTDGNAAAVAEGSGGGGGGDGVRPYRPKLQHSVFEEPTDTLARLSAAGWVDCKLLTAEELGAKYGVPRAQPILLGCTRTVI